MLEFVQFFYLWILPIFSIFSIAYLISLLITKNETFNKINSEFRYAIEVNKKISNEQIKEHYKNVQNYTDAAIEKINSSSQLEELTTKLELINKLQKNLVHQLQKIQSENEELNKKIKEREAIIDRKSQQISRLKEKNEI